MPTETVYGLAARIDNEAGLKKIFSIKERPFFDPLIVHISDLSQVKTIVREWPPLADFLTKIFWPGPLTFVLPKQEKINPLITAGLDTVGLRMPAHPVAQELIRACGVPLAAPSANKFGKTSPTLASHVEEEFGDEVYVLDGDASKIGLESTVVGLEMKNGVSVLKIFRPGFVTEEKLRAAMLAWKNPFEISSEESIASPGHLKAHYQPKLPLVIISEAGDLSNFIQKLGPRSKELPLNENPVIAARELYASLRTLGAEPLDFLFVKRKPYHSNDLWTPIWDRLKRAASFNVS